MHCGTAIWSDWCRFASPPTVSRCLRHNILRIDHVQTFHRSGCRACLLRCGRCRIQFAVALLDSPRPDMALYRDADMVRAIAGARCDALIEFRWLKQASNIRPWRRRDSNPLPVLWTLGFLRLLLPSGDQSGLHTGSLLDSRQHNKLHRFVSTTLLGLPVSANTGLNSILGFGYAGRSAAAGNESAPRCGAGWSRRARHDSISIAFVPSAARGCASVDRG